MKLPLPDDPDVIEVIPAQVEVSLCGGVCHEGNLYHKCVPKTGARTKKTVQVSFAMSQYYTTFQGWPARLF